VRFDLGNVFKAAAFCALVICIVGGVMMIDRPHGGDSTQIPLPKAKAFAATALANDCTQAPEARLVNAATTTFADIPAWKLTYRLRDQKATVWLWDQNRANGREIRSFVRGCALRA
jgi:hypothetical protein